jgi:alpha-1,3-glucosyltransferase
LPTYRSTDFDVHRNWLAITHKLPLSQWYFDNVNGTTVHTLDYPPNFAYFEWILSNNPLTKMFLPENDQCLDLLPDWDNTPSNECVIFQRSTVILSDIILWIGAYVACRAMFHGKSGKDFTVSFLLIVLNPGLLFLDHVHFQYNGMLLGVLLLSLGLLMNGNLVPPNSLAFDLYHLGGAAVFAILLNLKHLYATLGPLYFFYLLKRYCLGTTKRLRLDKFLMLSVVTAGTLIVPWIPFLLVEPNPKEQIQQIVSRLFPFGRGLVHDYWAANVWSLYMLGDKGVRFLSTKFDFLPTAGGGGLPDVPPIFCALFLLFSMIPGLQVAISDRLSNVKLIESVVYCSFCSFMLSYHVHEKAILTTLIPLSLLVGQGNKMHNLLFWQVAMWGLVALFPLLFEPTELGFELVSYFSYMALCSYLLRTTLPTWWTNRLEMVTGVLLGGVILVLEVLPIQGRLEFLPLMIASIVCALGLIGCWALSCYAILRDEK